MRVGIAVFCLAQAVLIGLSTWARSVLLLALGEVALLCLTAVLVLIGRYVALRAQYTRERQHHQRQAERRRIADDVHDLIGHELSLIAMRAGLLQLQTEGDQAQLAGELRSRAEDAVHTLHDSLALLSCTPAEHATSIDPLALVEQHRAAGAEISVKGALDAVGVPTRIIATSVVREALTNAARHAPDKPVEVILDRSGEEIRVTVVTQQEPGTTATIPEGHGLTGMRRRLDSVGGTLDVHHDQRGHVLAAHIPAHVVRAAPPSTPPRGNRPLRRVIREAAVPLTVVIAMVVAFYAWAEHGAIIEPEDQARLKVGTSSAVGQSLLPGRQAPIRLSHAATHPRRWDCRSYTNGNFPLAVATFEVCLDNGAVVRVTDLAAKPLW